MTNTDMQNLPRPLLVQCLPENFKWIRKSFFRFTIQQVSNATGLSPHYISTAENGKCDKFSVLSKIRDYYLGQYNWKRRFPESHPNAITDRYELC